MTAQITLYLSYIIGRKLFDSRGSIIGKIKDVLIDTSVPMNEIDESVRPKVIAFRIKSGKYIWYLDASQVKIEKKFSGYRITAMEVVEVPESEIDNLLFLAENILDKQLVDINGRKLVRVNDVRMVILGDGIYTIAVDVGIEGLLRRIGIDIIVKKIAGLFGLSISSNFILWDDVEAIDFSNSSIKLSKTSSKLNKLHPSDLADIIEDLGRNIRTRVFASLDEEHAADVLEELEPRAQIDIVENLPLEKVADVLEKMPADEVADILDELDKEKAELLLNEMDKESSKEVRELLEYSDNAVGSLMTTDFLIFKEEMTVEETLNELRQRKPEDDTIYSLYVTDKKDRLISSVSLRDLVVAGPDVRLRSIMKRNPVKVFDDDKIDSLAEIISKYNLLAIPVIDREHKLQGMVVIDDIVEDLLNKRKTK